MIVGMQYKRRLKFDLATHVWIDLPACMRRGVPIDPGIHPIVLHAVARSY
jgi:hypothetical protein